LEPTISTGDPRLDQVAEQVTRSGWAAMICDTQFRLLWVSDELKALIGEEDEARLGIGHHVLSAWWSDTWSSRVTYESELQAFLETGPYFVARAGKQELKDVVPQLSELIDQLEPTEPPPAHVTFFNYLQGDLPPVRVVSIAIRLTETARHLSVSAHAEAKLVAEETGLLEPEECLINVGLHWGGHLYMGQLVTGGRLEVTALGDRVNECARIEQAARDGQILATKSLIEHLTDEDSKALDIDPDGVVYRMVGELVDADEKAVRDAGNLPVTEL
jgi:hypothetical protein